MNDAHEVRCLRVDAGGHAERLDKWLALQNPEFSRSYIQGLVQQGHVRLDGAACRQSAKRLRAGSSVELELVPTDESRAFTPEAMPLAVVFEDDHLMVVNKPSGLVVHPAPGHWRGTLVNGLLAHHVGAMQLPRAGIVHRLDKDTSGLMVVAKSVVAMTALTRAIAAREVRREYLAIVQGAVAPASFSIEAPIGRDPVSRVRMAISPHGKPAKTDVHVIGGREGYSRLLCRLHTGRTHQIRVHLSSRGHPLVGDATYGGATALGLSRQALHATRLGFVHPLRPDTLAFEAPLPDDMAAAWAVLGG